MAMVQCMWLLGMISYAGAQGLVMMDGKLVSPTVTLQKHPDVRCDKRPTKGYVCPPDFTAIEDDDGPVCLWVSSHKENLDYASLYCSGVGAEMLSIKSQARQDTVTEFLKNVDAAILTGGNKPKYTEMYEWQDGTRFNYTNIDSQMNRESRYVRVVVLLNNEKRTWDDWGDYNEFQFVCQSEASCTESRFGKWCEKECHCDGSSCQDGEPCSGQCQAGWEEDHCCIQDASADIAHYCENGLDGQGLVIRVDPKNTLYEALYPVDADGQATSWCQNVIATRSLEDFVYTLKIPVDPHSTLPQDCGGQKIGNNTYQWKLALQQTRGLRMPMDKHIVFTCDFDDAETMSRSHDYSVLSSESKDLVEPVESPDPVVEDVVLEVIDAVTGDVITQAEMGTSVILQMSINSSSDLTAQGVSPFNCQASVPGSNLTYLLTDHSGCPTPSKVMSSLKGGNGTVSSDPFVLFNFSGHKLVSFTCNIQFCFTEDELPTCDDRCANTKRSKRSIERSDSVSTLLVIIS